MTRTARAARRPTRPDAGTDGPPQGPGRYSEDGRHWWDEDHGRWFRTTGAEDHLEIEVEEGPVRSVRRFAEALTRRPPRLRYRFVARAHSSDLRWPTYAIASEPFTVEGHARDAPPTAVDPWADGMTACLWDLERRLVEHGWLPRGRHTQWWASRYVRPALDWDAPPEASRP